MKKSDAFCCEGLDRYSPSGDTWDNESRGLGVVFVLHYPLGDGRHKFFEVSGKRLSPDSYQKEDKKNKQRPTKVPVVFFSGQGVDVVYFIVVEVREVLSNDNRRAFVVTLKLEKGENKKFVICSEWDPLWEDKNIFASEEFLASFEEKKPIKKFRKQPTKGRFVGPKVYTRPQNIPAYLLQYSFFVWSEVVAKRRKGHTIFAC